ncbi:MAG: hypothetical protein MJ094_09205 [Saccharofermentans sp.]|nr:hypothetical protein [Saccharofermentans sp.]
MKSNKRYNLGLKSIARLAAVLLCAFIVAAQIIPTIAGSQVDAAVDQPNITITPIDDINCASYCVYDKTEDRIIMGRQAHDRIYPASMTKLMTIQLAMDYLDPDDYTTVSQNAIDNVTSDSTLMYLIVGEEIKISELYYGLMLPSGNDAANVLAEATIHALFELYPEGGDVGPDGVNATYFVNELGVSSEEILTDYPLSAFSLLMNLRATNLGCTGSHFVNPHGLHSDNHYTTASDLCIIMAHAAENPDFCTVISSPTHVFQATNMHTSDAWSTVRNTNQLLTDPWMASYTAEGEATHITAFIGGKTGTTSTAGTGMTTYSVNENGHELFIAVCGIPYAEYSNQTRYVTSAVAYGNYQCWQNDPVSRLPGTLGDYQRFNWTAEARPVLDTVIVPGDAIIEEPEPTNESGAFQEELDVANPTEALNPEAEVIIGGDGIIPADGENPDGGFLAPLMNSEVGRFVQLNPGVSVLILVLILIIIVLVIILIARSFQYSNHRRGGRNKVREYRGPTF